MKFKEIDSIKFIDKESDVYDIEVENSHMFLANGNYVHNCTTSANTGIHFPMASLISGCYEGKTANNFDTKIVADGGFKNFDQINKALAIGADYVMLGQILAKSEEACGEAKFGDLNGDGKFVSNNPSFYPYGGYYREYYGMSTKRAQKEFGKEGNTTAEGIAKWVKIEYPINKWIDNFKHYLRSAMSYTNSLTLNDFKDSQCCEITPTGRISYFK